MQIQLHADTIEDSCNAIESTGNHEAVMTLHDDRWMMLSEGAASVILAAVLVPEQSMEQYDRNGYENVGLNLDKILNFVKRSDSDLINLWMEKRTLHIEEVGGNTHAELATKDVESIGGRTDKNLNVDHEVSFEHDFSIIMDFIKKADEITDTDHFFLGGRENGLYMYGEYDNGRIDDFYSWDEFSNVDVDFGVNNYSDLGHEPAKDKAIDVILGSDYTKELYQPQDEAHISIGNHFPMRLLYELENGTKISYFQTPRLPTSESARTVIPDRVIEKHM